MYGITVHLALPASILSPSFIDYEQKIKPELCKKIEGPDEPLTPEQVATRMLKGLFRGAQCRSRLSSFPSVGLERNEYYITVEPIGTMLRNSRGIVPRNNVVMDTLWGIAGTVRFLLSSFLRSQSYWLICVSVGRVSDLEDLRGRRPRAERGSRVAGSRQVAKLH